MNDDKAGSASAERREQRLRLLEDHIGRALTESERSGELKAAPSYGRPLDFGDGYDETPAELRMGYKILKDAGVVPPEVELMQQIEALRRQLETTPEGATAQALHVRLSELRQALALQLERLRPAGPG